MKYPASLFCLLIIAASTFGQTWAPLGAKWTYGVSFAFLPNIEYRQWQSLADTLMNGHNCKIIYRSGSEIVGDVSDRLITYEDSNRIYWYNDSIDQFTVLYDFNKNAGETWTVLVAGCDLVITVESTGTDTINGIPLKYLMISSEDWAFTGKIVEHIGHTLRPSPDIIYHCYGIAVDGSYYTGLRCYEDSLVGFHDFGIAPYCDYTNLGIHEKENAGEFLLSPNPATTQISIIAEQASEYVYEVYNSTGQSIVSGHFEKNATIDAENLPAGNYWIMITSHQNVYRKAFLITR